MSINEPTLETVVPSKLSKNEIASARTYSENSNRNPSATDVLNQFRANMSTLEDLNGRMSFIMTEIRGLIRK